MVLYSSLHFQSSQKKEKKECIHIQTDISISYLFMLSFQFSEQNYFRIAAYSEWKILYMLCKDKQGLLHKETIRAVYDGSLFEQMAKEKASKKQA